MKRIWDKKDPLPKGMIRMMKKIHWIAVMTAVMIILGSVLPATGALAEKTGVVKGGWLILRASPSFSGQIRSSYPTGTVVKITGQVGSRYAVTAPDGLSGYMYGDYLQINGSSGGSSYIYETTAYVTSRNGLNVRLRSGPGKGYSIIASYAPGTKCTILSSGKNWCRIQIGSYTGYMMTQFLTNTPGTNTYTEEVQLQPTAPEGSQVYVTSRNGQGVNLRSGPDKAYPSIGFYSVGTPATMITKGSTWSYIQIGNRYGYMMTQFLTGKKPDEPIIPVSGAYVVSANGKSVNLRTAPTTASSIIRSFKVGTKLTIITRGNDWYFVQINGYYGYMMRQFIYDGTPQPAPEPPDPPKPPKLPEPQTSQDPPKPPEPQTSEEPPKPSESQEPQQSPATNTDML